MNKNGNEWQELSADGSEVRSTANRPSDLQMKPKTTIATGVFMGLFLFFVVLPIATCAGCDLIKDMISKFNAPHEKTYRNGWEVQ